MRGVHVFHGSGHVLVREEPAERTGRSRCTSGRSRELLAAASSASCHEAMNVLSGRPGRSSRARACRLRARFAHAGHG